MKFLLDTNICIYIIKQNPSQVAKEFKKYRAGDIGISSITVAEMYYGAAKSQQQPRNEQALYKFLAPLIVSNFNDHASMIYGKIRADLERSGTPIGALDLLIAAHALALQVPLVTNNMREFARIPNLKLENWVQL